MSIEEIFKAIQAGGDKANRAFEEFYGTFDKKGNAISSELRVKMSKHINKKFRVTDDTIIDIIIEDAIIKIFQAAPGLKNLDGINGWFWMNLDSRAKDYFRREGTQKNIKNIKKDDTDTYLPNYEMYKDENKKYTKQDKVFISKKIVELEKFNETDSFEYKRLLIIKDEIDTQFEQQDRSIKIKEIEMNDIEILDDENIDDKSKISQLSGLFNWSRFSKNNEDENFDQDVSFARESLDTQSSKYMKDQIEIELVECMRNGLSKLEKDKPEHSKVLTMRFILGNSIEEIKDEIGRTADATKTFIHYCLKTDMSYFEGCL